VKWENIENEFYAIKNLYVRGTSKYIVEIFGMGRLDEGIFFIDMELCGQPLSSFIAGENAIAERQVDTSRAQIMWEVASGIEFIHGCNAVHRDLKPSNGKIPSY